MKKLLLLFAMFFAFSASASTIPDGAIVKTANNPDVYIVKYNQGKQYKRLVLNPLVFQSYGHLKWENLLTISDSEMSGFLTSDLVRVDGSADVYQLVPEGDTGGKFLMTSLDGCDPDSVYTINSVDFGNYSARGSKSPFSTTEVNTASGKIKVTSTMPFDLFDIEAGDIPMNQLKLQTWYGADTNSAYAGSYGFAVRLVELNDLSKLNLSVEMPDGRIAYAKNFTVSRVSDKWQVSSQHDEMLGMYILDYYEVNQRYYDWSGNNTPDIFPDAFQNQEFAVFLYAMVNEGSQR